MVSFLPHRDPHRARDQALSGFHTDVARAAFWRCAPVGQGSANRSGRSAIAFVFLHVPKRFCLQDSTALSDAHISLLFSMILFALSLGILLVSADASASVLATSAAFRQNSPAGVKFIYDCDIYQYEYGTNDWSLQS